MAFCNSCGATLADGTQFCNKCGSPVTAPAMSTPTAGTLTPVTPSKGGSGALKIILIIVAVVVVLGILGIGAVSFIGYRIAKSAHVHQDGDNVKVETPFGSVESSKDPSKAAADLGIDIYPGAEVQKNGASSATFGSIHTVTAMFTSSDGMDKVCSFYKEKFPNSIASTADQNHCTLVSNDNKNMVTINVESTGDGSKFQVTNVTKSK
jgi:zinc-ribbon domain